MTSKTTTKKSCALFTLSCGILLAITLSAVKLWEACHAAIGYSLATWFVPALFCFFAGIAHFAGEMLSRRARRWALAWTYGFKLIASITVSVTANAAMICGQAVLQATAGLCAGSQDRGELSMALIALAGHHPLEVMVPVFVYLFFLLLGDGLALGLEFLHNSVEAQDWAHRGAAKRKGDASQGASFWDAR